MKRRVKGWLDFWQRDRVKENFYPALLVLVISFSLTLVPRIWGNFDNEETSGGEESPSVSADNDHPSSVIEFQTIDEKTPQDRLNLDQPTESQAGLETAPEEPNPQEPKLIENAHLRKDSIFINPVDITNSPELRDFAEVAELKVLDWISQLKSLPLDSEAKNATFNLTPKFHFVQKMGDAHYKKTVDPEMILTLTITKGSLIILTESYRAKGDREYATSNNGGVSQLVAKRLGEKVLSEMKEDLTFRNEIKRLFN